MMCVVLAVTAFLNSFGSDPSLRGFNTCSIAIASTLIFLPFNGLFLSRCYCLSRHRANGQGDTSPQRQARVEHTKRRPRASAPTPTEFGRRFLRGLYLYYSAPIVKFFTRRAHFFFFVLLYTFVSFNWDQGKYKLEEGLMHAWILALLVSQV